MKAHTLTFRETNNGEYASSPICVELEEGIDTYKRTFLVDPTAFVGERSFEKDVGVRYRTHRYEKICPRLDFYRNYVGGVVRVERVYEACPWEMILNYGTKKKQFFYAFSRPPHSPRGHYSQYALVLLDFPRNEGGIRLECVCGIPKTLATLHDGHCVLSAFVIMSSGDAVRIVKEGNTVWSRERNLAVIKHSEDGLRVIPTEGV